MVTADDLDVGEANRKVIAGWIDDWRARVIDVARTLAPVAEQMPRTNIDFEAELQAIASAQGELISELGLGGGSK